MRTTDPCRFVFIDTQKLHEYPTMTTFLDESIHETVMKVMYRSALEGAFR